MLAAGYATYKVLAQEANLSPISMAGHSLGEYTALVASNSINFFDAIQLVRKRGELMQKSCSKWCRLNGSNTWTRRLYHC